jgi:hypothetical protein
MAGFKAVVARMSAFEWVLVGVVVLFVLVAIAFFASMYGWKFR